MKPSNLLKKAKECLFVNFEEFNKNRRRNDKAQYICNAVKMAAGGRGGFLDGGKTPEAREVVAHIDQLLEGIHTFDLWLKEKHDIDVNRNDPKQFDQLQATRLAWMDDMIKYWKEQGQ